MKKILPGLVILTTVLAACNAENYSAREPLAEVRSQCAHEFNGPDRPCQVSPYMLVSSGASGLEDMYVEAVLFHPGLDARLLFVNQDAAEYEDYSSSFLVLGANASKLPKTKGFYRVVAKFKRDFADYGVGSGVFRQAGTFTELVRVRPLVAVSTRVEECRQLRCVVKYQDGMKQDSP